MRGADAGALNASADWHSQREKTVSLSMVWSEGRSTGSLVLGPREKSFFSGSGTCWSTGKEIAHRISGGVGGVFVEWGPLHPWRSCLDIKESVFLISLQEHGSTPTFYAMTNAGTDDFFLHYRRHLPCWLPNSSPLLVICFCLNACRWGLQLLCWE